MYACLYQPPPSVEAERALLRVAEAFSPRYECHGAHLITIDVSGLDRLLGPPRVIGEELRRACADRGLRAHVAVAPTWTAAAILAHARAGLTVVSRGGEADALAPIGVGILETIATPGDRGPRSENDAASAAVAALKRWGLKTLGEFAALPADAVAARLGRASLAWQAMARGADVRPLVPTLEAERFDASLDLEWPIEELEPLSFVLTRLLESLVVRLERRDRGAAVLHVVLRLVTREVDARRIELPSPIRDVRTLRTLALLDLESRPASAGIDRVGIVIDPTPGRVLQHTLFTRAHPTPEQLSTLVARLTALMGQDRIGAPVEVDSDRPGAFTTTPFATEHAEESNRGDRGDGREHFVSSLRRCRQPVPARVSVDVGGRPSRVTTDRRGFAGGSVLACAGPWRTSGEWWESERAGRAGGAGRAGRAGWDRDEWDVSLNDGAVYRIFCDRASDSWF